MDPEDIEKAIRRLASRQLLIGIPADHDARPGDPIGNASLGYIHETGSPARNIPARPHLVPGVEQALPAITKRLEEAARAALEGNIAGVDQGFGRAGVEAVNSVRAVIQAGIPPPLAPATVAARRRRTPGSSYRRQATTAADVTPLIDSGDYIKNLTYVVRDRSRQG
jgi:hypothetical protein